MNEVFLCLGGNLGNREFHLSSAIQLLNQEIGNLICQSKIYETAAWGLTDQPNFLNCVVQLKTDLKPDELLSKILSIEKLLGRERKIKWGSRIIDIDILSYNSELIQTDQLTIPHPFLHKRKFVLIPFIEIAPKWQHPLLKQPINYLLENCEDECKVVQYTTTL